jgi:protein-S-isoprenylcysteine O-methyltransferase Ste14
VTFELQLLWLVQSVAILTFLGFMIFIFYPKYSSANGIKQSFFKDRNVVIQCGIFTFFYIVLFGHLFIFNNNYAIFPIYVLGVVLALSGLIVAFIARIRMRAVWSPITNTSESKEIMSKGIFSIMRHPVYVGRLLFFTGTMVMFNIKLLILAVLYWYFLRKKAIEEEQHLAKTNPKYKEYLKKVKRLF